MTAASRTGDIGQGSILLNNFWLFVNFLIAFQMVNQNVRSEESGALSCGEQSD